MKPTIDSSLSLLLLLVGLSVGSTSAAGDPSSGGGMTPHAGMLRNPDVSATHIAFRYSDDLWLVSRAGGVASPLASPPGAEYRPRFSPDGKTLAFMGNYDGDPELYTVPVVGGEPLRVTYQPSWQVLSDWTPDGRLIFSTASRQGHWSRRELFTVSASGGLPEPLPVPYGAEGAISSDGQWLAYSPNSTRSYETWKRYVGGTASEIWLFNLRTNESRKITDWEGTDAYPMWHAGILYYLSDAGPARRRNIWTYNLESGRRSQITHFTRFDVRSPAAGPGSDGGGEIVFSVGEDLHLLDLTSGTDHKVEVEIPGARPRLRTVSVDVSDAIGPISISPAGDRVAAEARGDIWTLPAEHGTPRNLTRSSGAGERSPAWSPDGRWIAFFSDRSGEYELHVVQSDGEGEESQLTFGHSSFFYRPSWSPDSKHIVFQEKTGDLWLHTMTTGETRGIATDPWARALSTVSWSPDSRWLAFDLSESAGSEIRSIWLYEMETSAAWRVTSALADERLPAFGREGNYLFFVAKRFFEPSFSAVEFAIVHQNTEVLAAMPLRSDVDRPYRAESDEVSWKATGGNESAGTKGSTSKPSSDGEETTSADDTVRIELAGLQHRSVALPVERGSFASLDVDAENQLIYVRRSAPDGDGESKLQLFDFDGDDPEEKTIATKVTQAQVTANGEKVAARDSSSGAPQIYAPKPDAEGKPVVNAAMLARIDPREEWQQLFNDAWRLFRDFFYADNMHGLNWEEVRQHYAAMLPDCASRDDLTFVMEEMISELNVGHARLGGGAPEEDQPEIPAGVLGADFERSQGGYRVARIYRGPDWDMEYRSPLLGHSVDVKEGEFLLAVNGIPVNPELDPWAAFVGLADREVVLTVGPSPRLKQEARQVVVRTRKYEWEMQLRSRDWVESNRKYVEEKSQGRVGYVHIPNYGRSGFNLLVQQYFPQRDRAAIIIDQRFNGGGWTPHRFLEILNRPPMMFRARRDGRDRPVPESSHFGPKCMLMNELSGSSADMLPWMFRHAGLGKLIGTRTWGGVVGLSGNPSLIDGQRLVIPNNGTYSADGRWIIEGWGVEPDVEVLEDPSKMLNGEDPQLDAAIREMLRELESGSYERPAQPNNPDRSGMGVPRSDI